MRGVLLYGPPAAGKDTITRALCELDPTYRLFQRLKAGPGRTAGYRMTDMHEVEHLRAEGQVVWENQRYGVVYVIDRRMLWADLTNHVPVLHLGQVEAVQAVKSAAPEAHWLTVYLYCPREAAQERILARATGDTEDRLRAWDETPPLPGADLVIDTATVAPGEAAREVHERLASVTGCVLRQLMCDASPPGDVRQCLEARRLACRAGAVVDMLTVRSSLSAAATDQG